MLPKENRLNLEKDFKWVAAGKKRGSAKRIETKFAKLFIRTGENTSPRVGIAVSAKYFKKATARNRAKRLVSTAFESLYPVLPKDINILVLPKHNVLEVKSGEVLKDLEQLLKRERVIMTKS